MSRKYLLGATKDNELVFGELELSHPKFYSKERGHYTDNSVMEFSASFCTVRPFNAESFDIEDYWNNYIEEMECCDNGKWVLEELKRRDCTYSDLAGELANECEDARECIDCSLYPEEVVVENPDTNEEEIFYFESGSAGQHDTRDEMEEIINPEAYNLLNELWDKYHLKKVEDSVISQVEELIDTLTMSDEEEENWIREYIQNHYEDIVE